MVGRSGECCVSFCTFHLLSNLKVGLVLLSIFSELSRGGHKYIFVMSLITTPKLEERTFATFTTAYLQLAREMLFSNCISAYLQLQFCKGNWNVDWRHTALRTMARRDFFSPRVVCTHSKTKRKGVGVGNMSPRPDF
jgi:hypothetical protein